MNRGTGPSRSRSPQPFNARPKRRIVPPATEALEARTLLSRLSAAVTEQAVRPSALAGSSVVLLTVPGQAGQMVTVTFHLDDRQASYRNEMGIFPVLNANGRVGQFRPGAPGYLRAALTRPGARVIFGQDAPKGSSVTVMLPGGTSYGLYLVANGSTQEAFHARPRLRPRVYVSMSRGNIDRFAHIRAEAGATFAWEDLPRGGDRDFNDMIARVTFGNNNSGGNGGGNDGGNGGNNGGGNGGGSGGNGGGGGNGGSSGRAPVVTLSSQSGRLSRTNILFAGNASDADGDLALLQYKVDGGGLNNLAFNATTGAFTYPTTFALDGTADGTHELQFVATDRAGHTSNVATTNFILDTKAPAVAFDLAPESDTDTVGDHMTDLSSVNLLGRTEAGLSLTLVETGAVATADASGNFRFDGVSLPLGVKTFHVRATDAAGNVGTATQSLIHCGFAGDLSGWNVSQDGGSDPGKGTVTPTDGHALLREGDSFLVNIATGFTIPAGATKLQFDLDSLDFDTASTGSVRDAFEVALVDSQGRPIVPTIGNGRDAFYNRTEGLDAALGSGTTVSGSIVSVDLSGVAVGTAARLVFRLVNNDEDTETHAEIGCVVVVAGEASFVPGAPGTPGQTTTFASNGSGGASNLTALLAGVSSSTTILQSGSNGSTTTPTTSFTSSSSSNSTQSLGTSNANAFTSNGSPTANATTLVGPAVDTSNVPTSAGREFWIAFSDNLVEGGRIPVKTLFITGDVATHGTVSIPGLSFTQDFSVTPGQITSVPLPADVQVTSLAEIENKGVHIVADDPVTVYGLNTAQATTDAFLALPVDSLGTRYVNMAYGTTSYLLAYLPSSQITIVGAHDGTNVTITPGPGVTPINNSNVAIIGPDGRVVGSDGNGNDIGPISLGQSGDFTLKVDSPYPTHAGTYSYRILNLDADSAALTLNQDTRLSLPTGQETKVYKFQGTIGHQIVLNGLDRNGQNVSVRLVTPSLRVDLQQGSEQSSGLYTLPETGTYYVIVSGQSNTPVDTGFKVVDASVAPTLIIGTPVTGSLPTGRETVAYRFQGNAGRPLAFDGLSGQDGNVGYQITGPGGVVVANSSFGADSDPFTLPLDGEYKVIITGRTSAAYSYAFRLMDLSASPNLAIGTTATALFPQGRESRWYNVNLTAGQMITYDTLGGDQPGSQARLVDPAGNALFTLGADRNTDPVLITRSGTYRLQIQATQGNPLTIPFRLLDANAGTSVTVGSTVTATLPTGRETLLYRFNADAGDAFIYDGLAGTFQSVTVSIYDPAGNRLTDVSADGDRGPMVASVSGTYTLAFYGGSDTPGEVHFRVLKMSTSPTLTLGATATATLPTGGETLAYRFHGTAGQTLFYDPEDASTNAGGFELYGPGMQPVSSGNALGDRGPIVLDEDGTYTLIIRGGSATATSFDFRLLDAATVPALSTSTANAGTLDPASRMAVYRFNSPGNQTLAVDMMALSNTNGGSWYLFGPDGRAVIGRNLDQNWSAPLARAGAYQLVLFGSGGASPLTYSFNASLATQAAVAPTGFGTKNTLNITAGNTATYTFNAPGGRLIYLDSLDGQGENLVVSVKDPNGALILNTNDTSDSGPWLLPTSGTYTLALAGNTPEAAGSYAFRILDLSAATAIDPGDDVSGTIDDALGSRAYRINSVVGLRLLYDSPETDFANVALSLLDPSGNFISTSNADNQNQFGPLTQGGSYILLIQNNTAASATYHFRLTDPDAAPTLALNTDVSGTFPDGRSSVVYQFVGTAGQTLYYDSLLGDFPNASVTLVGPGDVNIFASNRDNNNGPVVLPEDGTYRLVFRSNTSAALPYAFNLRDLSSAGTLAVGSTAAADLGATGKGSVAYKISVNAGQTLLFDGLDAATNIAGFRLIDPFGRTVAARNNNDDFYPINGGVTGVYTLLIEGYATGATTVHFRMLDAAAGTAITAGSTVNATLPTGRETVVYRFSATAGHNYYYNGLNAGGAQGTVEIYDRNFNFITVRNLEDDVPFTAAFTGSYYVVIRGRSDTAIDHSFKFLDLADATPLAIGSTASGTLPTGREYVAYAFDGTAGQTLFYDGLGSTPTNKEVRIIGPAGDLIRTGQADGNLGPITLTATGTYTILIAGADASASTYKFRVLDVASAPALASGTPVSGTLSDGNVAVYRINAAAAEALLLHASTLPANTDWFLYDPSNGQVIANGINADLAVTTQRTGTYILVLNYHGIDPVNYTIVSTLTPDAPVTTSGFGAGTLEVPIGGSQSVNFSAPAGARLYLDRIVSQFTIPVQTIHLDAGQTYQLRQVAGGDMTGTLVTSDKPVAVFGGNLAAFVPDGYAAANHLVEQLPSTDSWGREFLTYPLATRLHGDVFRIVAQADDTEITINGTLVATIDAGHWYETNLEDPSRIQTNHAVLVAQFSHSLSFDNVSADPFMIIVPPFEQFLDHYTITTPATGFPTNFVNVVAPASAVGSIELDGVPLAADLFHAIGDSGYVGAQVPIDVGAHDFAGAEPFGVFVYGYAVYDGYGYLGGQSLAPVALVDSIALTPASVDRQVGTSQTFTARVLDVNGNPLVGVRVDFNSAGSNVASGFAFSDENGNAVFTLAGANAGSDVIVASVGDVSKTATIRWRGAVEPPTVVVDTPSDGSSAQADTDLTLTGLASASVTGVAIVAVTVNGVMVDVLDAAGRFFAKVHVRSGSNSYQVVATDSNGQTAQVSLTVQGVQSAPGSVDFSQFADVTGSFTPSYARTSYNEAEGILYADFAVKNSGQYDANAPLLVGIANISDPSVQVLGASGKTPDGVPYYDFTGLVTGGKLAPDGQTGFLNARFLNPNHSQFTYSLVFLGKLNEAPTITSLPAIEAIAGKTYTYNLTATDPEDDTLTYRIVSGPDGLTIDNAGHLSWAVGTSDIGSHDITVEVDDGQGGLAQQRFVLQAIAAPPNRPPVFTSVPGVLARVGSPYQYQATATDPDGDDLAFSLESGPTGLAVATNGLVTLTPTPDQIGQADVVLAVSDGRGGRTLQSFQICIRASDDNHAPVFVTLPQAFATPGTYASQIKALDSDPGQTLTYHLIDGPDGLTLDSSTGALAWSPTSADLGSHPVTIEVSDGVGGTDSTTFNLVVNQNTAPTITTSTLPEATIGSAYAQVITASDPDSGNTLTFSLAKAPAGMSIDPASGQITWTPGSSAFASTPLTVQVDDDAGGVTREDFVLTVRNGQTSTQGVNPQFVSVPPTTIRAGDLLNYLAKAWTPLAATLTYDLATAPAGMVIDPATGSLAWRPEPDDVGGQTVVIRARDGLGGIALQSFTLNVTPANTAPVIANSPASPATVGLPWTFKVAAQDAENDPITVRLVDGPTGMTVAPWAGGDYLAALRWTPAGPGSFPVTIEVDDGQGGVTTLAFTLEVVAAPGENHDPSITSSPPSRVSLGATWTYPIAATDPDGDPLTFSLASGPDGLTIDAATGRLTYTPTNAALGDHGVSVVVSDGRGGSTTQSFTLIVTADKTNGAPAIVSTPPTALVPDGRTFDYALRAIDPDGDPVQWSLDSSPHGVSIDPAFGTLVWTPDESQRGPQTIVVRVTDPSGASGTQTIQLLVECADAPPSIVSTPSTDAGTATPYFYGVRAVDPENDKLTYSLDQAPAGMTIDPDTGLIRWTPIAAQVGAQQVSVKVTDGFGGEGIQSFTAQVVAVTPDRTPAIISIPPLRAPVGADYTYQVRAVDPEGQAITYSLISPPTGMAIDATTGLIHWTPTVAQAGAPTITVAADDPGGHRAYQRYTLLVRTNAPPVITEAPASAKTAAAGGVYRYDVQARDPEGDALTYSIQDAPDGMTIDGVGRIRWTTSAGDAGSHTFTVVVTDAQGASASQLVNFSLVPDTKAPIVKIVSGANPASIGNPVVVVVQATDDIGLANVTLTLDGERVAINADGQATLTFASGGVHNLVATGTDAAGNVGSATLTLRVIDPADTDGPVVTVTSPAPGSSITAPTPIIGTVSSPDLERYRVEYALASDVDVNDPTAENPAYHFITEKVGSASITNGPLATFDPSLLLNDSYVIRVLAFDTNGNATGQIIPVDVTGQRSVGQYQITVTDLAISVVGIPITVSRTYDTRQANTSGDFGYGWSLAVQDARISESVPVNPLEVEGQFYAATPFKDGTRVYINAPNGRREGFTFKAVPQFSWFGGGYYLPSFVPDPGVHDTLSVDATALTRLTDGTYAMQYIGFPYNPSIYRLETTDGTTYQYNQFKGLESVNNRAGNTLTYTSDGITSSSGVSVKFDRDPQGRIVKIEVPGGVVLTYSYDANGDLITAKDPTNRATTYGYLDDPAHPHFLSSITDPAGNASTAQFDSDGKLIGLADASGNTTTNTYDTVGGSQTIVDALGNQTTLNFDDRGNVTKTVDPLGHTRNFTFDDADNLTSVTDPSGNTVKMTYDANGNVTSTTDALGNVSKVTYDDHNNITSVTDALGRTATTLYDEFGRTAGLINALGQKSTFTRDAQGRIITFTDNLGQVTRYEYEGSATQPTKTTYADGSVALASYDARGLLTKTADTAGNTWNYTYDAAGRPLTKTDPLGDKTTYAYDAVGQLVSVTDPLGQVTRYTYDEAGRRTSIIDPSGHPITYVYDANNRVVEEICCDDGSTKYVYRADGKLDHTTDADGGVTSYTYDATGNVLTVTDALGHVTSYTYDAMGKELTETDALGNTSSFDYDAAGNLVRATDALGKTITYAYDGLNRLVTTTDQVGQTFTTTYDAGGHAIGQTGPDGNQQSFTYDALGRMTSSTDANGKTTSYGYDSAGHVSTITDPLGQVTHRTYDAAGRMTSQTDPDGRTTSYAYDANNQTTSITSSDGTTTQMTYDSRGNALSVTDATGSTTKYEYDDEGRRIATVDALGNRTEFEYDCLGRLVKRTDPLGVSMSYEYDAVGNLTKYTDRDGRVRTYTYDALNRPVSESWQQASGTAVLDTFHYTYDALGRLVGASDENSSYTMTYDALGDLASVDNDGTPGLPHVVLTYERDAFGNVTSVKDNFGLTVSNTYDDTGHLLSTQWQGAGVADARADLTYDANGQLTSVKRFSDLAGTQLVGSTTNTYSNAGLLDSLTMKDASGNALVNYAYTYDDRGELTAETHHGQSWAYTYDDSGQLTSATLAGNPAASSDYSYDDQGNRTSEGETIGTANQVASDDTYRYTYDAEGNLTRRTRISDGSTTDYSFDLRNRLVGVTDRNASGTVTQAVSYTYDVFDRRIGKTVDGQTTYTVYDGMAPWADFNTSGAVTARYLASPDIDGLLARDRPGKGTTWYLADRLGTVRDLTDDTGQVIDHIDYDAYGQVTGETNPSVGDRFRYTGREYDAETGLYYYRARYYDASLGRFISQDPLGFNGADSNLYRYVGNSPTNATDPTGLQALSEYTALLPDVLLIANTAVTYGGDQPMTFAVGAKNGQPFTGVAGSPGLSNKFSYENVYLKAGPGSTPEVGVEINGFSASYASGDKGIKYGYSNNYWSGSIGTDGGKATSVGIQAFPNVPLSPTYTFGDQGTPLANPTVPGAGEFEFLVVSTAKTPNAVASWDVAVYGGVATELALIAKYASTDDSSTLVEVDFHEKRDFPAAEWVSHGFATRTPNPPFSGPLGPGGGIPPRVTTSNPGPSGPGGPPGPNGPPDDGDNGGGGSGPTIGCSSAPGLYGIRTIQTRSYLGTPALTTIASRDAGVLRLLNRVISF
ncbi:putative Ig domain-containing protein [Singulisphaera sp. PoT]|uniref:putative Ig domain-containing protein n=1 Tax=Singulisphaera sp. PoT TaxID=3411797 RepID=UPI003BF51E9D